MVGHKIDGAVAAGGIVGKMSKSKTGCFNIFTCCCASYVVYPEEIVANVYIDGEFLKKYNIDPSKLNEQQLTLLLQESNVAPPKSGAPVDSNNITPDIANPLVADSQSQRAPE